MFGTIAVNLKKLSKADKQRYWQYYCGLCHVLSDRYGSIGQSTLSYDMTFLALFCSSLYELKEQSGAERCVSRPIKKHGYIVTDATRYAADINLILAYYQAMDDWKDDGNRIARRKAKLLEKHLPRAKAENPVQFAAIAKNMARLTEMEKTNELNPDLPANCFGELMGALFVWREDAFTDRLRRMGAALGRFIYLLDAVNDLKSDIKKQRYNPLVAQLDTDFTPILTMMMAECTEEFMKLPLRRDTAILQNILYSGVWQKYRVRNQKGAKA